MKNINSVLRGNNIVADDVVVINSYVENSQLASGVIVKNSVLINCVLDKNCQVGPFSNLLSCHLGAACKVGNFVEIKRSVLGKNNKVMHHAYIGDAEIQNDCNIGCGVVFCNYDGKNKHKTTIGNRVFIGSNSNLIAPVSIADNAFIACGTTVTDNVAQDENIIGRSRTQTFSYNNLYLENFNHVPQFFGTDGVRGVWGKELTEDLVRKVAKSLCVNKPPVIVMGRDTRQSGNIISRLFTEELEKYDADIIDLGVVSTPCVSYLTRELKPDFGVVITASHNPKEYNGIKIFSSNGVKINTEKELELESYFDICVPERTPSIKQNRKISTLLKKYENMLLGVNNDTFEGLKIVIDCANGATAVFARKLFEKLKADVVVINSFGEINENAGALFPEIIKHAVLQHNADLGFSFDGDGDRIVAVNHNGQLLTGDDILYILAWYYKTSGLLNSGAVVGTILTNMGIENKLRALSVELIREPVGDKYIIEKMLSGGYELGAEQSGHVIINKHLPTGDGLLVARVLTSIYKLNQRIFESVKENKYVQVYSNINTEKFGKGVLKNKVVTEKIEFFKHKLQGAAKIIVRESGTEPKLRVMVEGTNENLTHFYCKELRKQILHALGN